jgi:hypothetical protein
MTALVKYKSQKNKPVWSFNIETPGYISEGKFIKSCYPSGIYIGDETIRVGDPENLTDIRVLKTDMNGQVVWSKTLHGGGGGADQITGIGTDANCNVYVSGTVYSGAGDGKDAIIAKINVSGGLVWSRLMRGPAGKDDWSAGLAVDANGNAYVVGTTTQADGGTDMVGLMLDARGVQQWIETYGPGSSLNYEGHAIAYRGGHVAIAGIRRSKTDFYRSSSSVAILMGANGDREWIRDYARPDSYIGNGPTKIDVTNDRDVYVTFPTAKLKPGGWTDITTLRHDKDGWLKWVSHYSRGGVKDSRGNDTPVAMTAEAGFITVAGSSQLVQPKKVCCEDFAVLRYDEQGKLVRKVQWGQLGDDVAYAMATKGAHAYVVGSSAPSKKYSGMATVKFLK